MLTGKIYLPKVLSFAVSLLLDETVNGFQFWAVCHALIGFQWDCYCNTLLIVGGSVCPCGKARIT